MSIKALEKPAKSERSNVARRTAGGKPASTRVSAAATTGARKREAPAEGGGSKLALLLQLLNRPEGASIEDMMRVSQWQKHSVRGFLAGTVKKKLGLPLPSSKPEGDVRRYRIASRRGR